MPVDDATAIRRRLKRRGAHSRTELRRETQFTAARLDAALAPLLAAGVVKADFEYPNGNRGRRVRWYWLSDGEP